MQNSQIYSTLFDSTEKDNRVNISFWIGKNNSVEFSIDRTNELPTFSKKLLDSNPNEFYNFIFDLFNSRLFDNIMEIKQPFIL